MGLSESPGQMSSNLVTLKCDYTTQAILQGDLSWKEDNKAAQGLLVPQPPQKRKIRY